MAGEWGRLKGKVRFVMGCRVVGVVAMGSIQFSWVGLVSVEVVNWVVACKEMKGVVR